MNPIIDTILKRKSIRAYMKKAIAPEVRAELLRATLRAPTAGNLMLYSIIEVTDQSIKNKLVRTCDNQSFIARAPLVWLFLADYQRWVDYFITSGVAQLCEQTKTAMRKPEEGDLCLACCDAIIAAQTAVIAAESFGLGSCYIGDIMENYEIHRDLFELPKYVFPICLVCFGYPTPQQISRKQTSRFQEKFILFENKYKRLSKDDLYEMFLEENSRNFHGREEIMGARNVGQLIYMRKFNAEFSKEMSRSVRAILKAWLED
ncbi:MAG: nitroreductase family protein [Anaerolineales bacterium]|jgi:nitroreductase